MTYGQLFFIQKIFVVFVMVHPCIVQSPFCTIISSLVYYSVPITYCNDEICTGNSVNSESPEVHETSHVHKRQHNREQNL